MKHTIRQHGQLTQIDCELGSGMLDKNGREIIEGDKVKCAYFYETVFTVEVARDGAFVFVDQFCNSYRLYVYHSQLNMEFEIVGRVGED